MEDAMDALAQRNMPSRRGLVKAGMAVATVLGTANVIGGSGARKAIADSPDQEATTNSDAPTVVEADVVVLGAGAAGLAAAATAAQAGSKVVVLESGSFAGGAAIYSGGHMLWLDEEFNAAQERNDADLQKYLDLDPADWPECTDDIVALQEQVNDYLADTERTGRFDSVERIIVDHYMAGSGSDVDGNPVHLDYSQIRPTVEACMDILSWLQSGGMEITGELYSNHGCSPVDNGSGLINALLSLTEDAGAQIDYATRATGLLLEDGRVAAVRAIGPDGEDVLYRASARVIIATGGYSANAPLVAMYQNIGVGLSPNCGTTNPSTNRGEGMAMAQRSGAAVRDLQFIMTVLEGYHSGSNLYESGMIASAKQLVVNGKGVRFADESNADFENELAENVLRDGMNDQTDGLGYFVGDAKMLQALDEMQDGLSDDLAERDWFFVADTLEDAASAAGLDPEAVRATVDAFNGYVADGVDPDFGRTEFNGAVEEAPFVVAKMEMHYHLTFGGLVIDENYQVIDVNGEPIPGLYAAGDVVSGFEGKVHQSGDCLSIVIHGGIVAATLA